MITEVSIIIIAVSFALLAGFAIAALVQVRKTVKSARKDLRTVSIEAVELMQKLEALTMDIQSKSEALNCVFRPLKSLNNLSRDTATEITDWVAISLILFEKIRAVVRRYEK